MLAPTGVGNNIGVMKIRSIAVAFPADKIDNKTIAAWTGGDENFISSKIGIESRAFLGANESMLDLSRAACKNLFQHNAGLDKSKVGLLIVVTQNPDHRIPHSSAMLQNALSLNVNTACFDISLGCSGYVYALSVARAFMLAENIRDGILVTCDPYSKAMRRKDYETVSVFGDAATATWLSAEKGADIGSLDYGTDGSGAHHLMVKAGGSAYPLSGIWNEQNSFYGGEDFYLRMNGRAIFNFMMKRVPGSVTACLRKNGLTAADIDYFIFHQASKYLIDNLRQRMDLEKEKVPIEINDCANTVSSSIPLMIHRFMSRGLLVHKTILVSGFGVGLSWATNIIRFGGD